MIFKLYNIIMIILKIIEIVKNPYSQKQFFQELFGSNMQNVIFRVYVFPSLVRNIYLLFKELDILIHRHFYSQEYYMYFKL